MCVDLPAGQLFLPCAVTVWYEYLLPVVLDGGDQASEAFDFIDALLMRQYVQFPSFLLLFFVPVYFARSHSLR